MGVIDLTCQMSTSNKSKTGPRIFIRFYIEELIYRFLIPSNSAYIWMQQRTLYVKTYWHILQTSRKQVANFSQDRNIFEQTFLKVKKLLFDVHITHFRKPQSFQTIAYMWYTGSAVMELPSDRPWQSAKSSSTSPTQNITSCSPSVKVAKETHGATGLNPSAQLPVLELKFCVSSFHLE